MIALSKPNHPLRLAGVLGASLLGCAIVAAAAFAVMYIVQDQRGALVSDVAGLSADPTQSDLNLAPGLVAWHRVPDADGFEELIGFRPFVPEHLPDATQSEATLAVSFPFDDGHRVGRVGFSPRDGYDVDGITGPTVVLNETKAAPGANPDGVLMRLTTGTGRALAARILCGDLMIDLQFYFGPAPKAGESYVNPYMTGVAQSFLDDVKGQCSG